MDADPVVTRPAAHSLSAAVAELRAMVTATPAGGSTEPGEAAGAAPSLQVLRLVPGDTWGPARTARLTAEVLVTAGSDALEAADLTAKALLTVLADGRWNVLPGQPDAAWWLALGRPPEAAFVVALPVHHLVDEVTAPPVRHALQIDGVDLRQVRGRVLAADGTALPGALVAVTPDGPVTRTGPDGRWSLTLPTAPVRLAVSAKRRRRTYDVAWPPTGAGAPGGAGPEEPIDLILDDIGAAPAVPVRGSPRQMHPDPSTPTHQP